MAISIIRLTLATGSDHHQIYHRDQVSQFTIITAVHQKLKIVILETRFSLRCDGTGWNTNIGGTDAGLVTNGHEAPPILHTLHPGPRHLPCPHLLHSIIPALHKQ